MEDNSCFYDIKTIDNIYLFENALKGVAYLFCCSKDSPKYKEICDKVRSSIKLFKVISKDDEELLEKECFGVVSNDSASKQSKLIIREVDDKNKYELLKQRHVYFHEINHLLTKVCSTFSKNNFLGLNIYKNNTSGLCSVVYDENNQILLNQGSAIDEAMNEIFTYMAESISCDDGSLSLDAIVYGDYTCLEGQIYSDVYVQLSQLIKPLIHAMRNDEQSLDLLFANGIDPFTASKDGVYSNDLVYAARYDRSHVEKIYDEIIGEPTKFCALCHEYDSIYSIICSEKAKPADLENKISTVKKMVDKFTLNKLSKRIINNEITEEQAFRTFCDYDRVSNTSYNTFFNMVFPKPKSKQSKTY